MSVADQITRINNNIAAAYETCEDKGATIPATQNSANLADTINSISGGGSSAERVEEKDINFYDYDGFLLYSYTFSEAAALTALPTLPTHTGLTAQEWTHSLSEVKAATTALDVGCCYVPTDGKTHLFVEVSDNTPVEFYLIQSGANAAVIDWGDGSPTETLSVSAGTRNNRTRYLASHTYSSASSPTEFDISISAVQNEWYGFGTSTGNGYSITGGGNLSIKETLKRMWLSVNANLNGACFASAHNLESVAAPKDQCFYFGASMCFAECYSLKSIIVNNQFGESAFQNCYSLRCLIALNTGTTFDIYDSFTDNCINLKRLIIPQGAGAIGNYAFRETRSANTIVLPSTITQINTNAFLEPTNPVFLECVNLTQFTDPLMLPALSSSSDFFTLKNYKYKYPVYLVANSQMKDAFSSATNWSAYASLYQVDSR